MTAPTRSPSARILSAFVLGVVALSSSTAWTAEESVGLKGILKSEPPASLDFDAFEPFLDLGGEWEKWSEGVQEALIDLHENPAEDIAGQRKQIADLREQLKRLQDEVKNPQTKVPPAKSQFTARALERRLDLAAAILDTLDALPAAAADPVDAARQSALTAANGVNAHLSASNRGDLWKSYLAIDALMKTLGQDTPDKQVLERTRGRLEPTDKLNRAQLDLLDRKELVRLAAALDRLLAGMAEPRSAGIRAQMRATLKSFVAALETYEENHDTEQATRRHIADVTRNVEALKFLAGSAAGPIETFLSRIYYLPNLTMFVSETFLNRVARDRRTENGVINDFVLGAQVTGNQTTDAEISVDLIPNAKRGSMLFRLHGNVTAATVGQKPTCQIKVHSRGYHQFQASKRAEFDGFGFYAAPAQIAVNANNQPCNAETCIDCMPLFGPILADIAISEARRMTPQANAITRNKIGNEGAQKMDEEVTTLLTDAGRDNIAQQQRLARENLSAIFMHTETSNDHFRLTARNGMPTEFAGDSRVGTFKPSTGVNIHVHENLLNSIADRMRFAGRTMTEREIQEEVRRFMKTVFLVDVVLPEDTTEEKPDRIIFQEDTPVSFVIEDDLVRMILHCSFDLPNRAGQDPIDPRFIVIDFKVTVEGGEIVITRVKIENRGEGGNVFAEAGGIRPALRKMIPEERRRSASIPIERPDRDPVDMVVQRIEAKSGWLSLWAE